MADHLLSQDASERIGANVQRIRSLMRSGLLLISPTFRKLERIERLLEVRELRPAPRNAAPANRPLLSLLSLWGFDETQVSTFDHVLHHMVTAGPTMDVDLELMNHVGHALESERLTGVDHFVFLKECAPSLPGRRLLDFGCGTGAQRARCEQLGFTWEGLDIPDSTESKARRSDDRVFNYAGLDVPFGDSSFDVVLAIQSLEHIQDPNLTFREIGRILKPGGRFIGSVSYLEGYHSNSTFNFTPYGFKRQLERGGMLLTRIHPEVDAFSLIFRRLMMQTRQRQALDLLTKMHNDSSLFNQALLEWAREKKVRDVRSLNALRLLFSGQRQLLLTISDN
ncbi:MAG: class I SAM-dependent methyltransferase [Polyangia bacterium]|jgi:SAM-dependent methyltransferase|nr:class I SAM-dependent methyltransferase [Polyangia bacterium]